MSSASTWASEMTCGGYFYDGRSSARHLVSVSRAGNELLLAGDGVERRYPLAAVRVTAPLGQLRRSLIFPDGGRCEVDADAPLEQLLGRTAAAGGHVHRWERSALGALLALLLTVAAVWAFLQFGIPVLAGQVARNLPPALEASLGEQTLTMLDRLALDPSTLPEPRREQVRALFAQLCRDFPDAAGFRLELRASEVLGANALALPAGIVVVTDAFVELAASDDQITAVLAHEVAHVLQRHALRQVLQSSATGVLVASLTGDLTSVTALAATLPTALVDARYSRRFEAEADDAAIAYLQRRGIPVTTYAEILRLLEQAHARRNGGAAERSHAFGDLFATHPETEARIARVLAAGR